MKKSRFVVVTGFAAVIIFVSLLSTGCNKPGNEF
jgi:hypothetical protein